MVTDDLAEDCNAVIDFMRKERGMSEARCLMALHFLLDSFPREYIKIQKTNEGMSGSFKRLVG